MTSFLNKARELGDPLKEKAINYLNAADMRVMDIGTYKIRILKQIAEGTNNNKIFPCDINPMFYNQVAIPSSTWPRT